MKAIVLTVFCLGLGFVSARWFPGSPVGTRVSAPATSLSARKPPPAAASGPKSTRSLNMEGDWRSEAKAWTKEDPAGLRDWLVERGLPPAPELLNQLFTDWAAQDADAAFEAAFNLPGDFNRQGAILDNMLNRLLEKPSGITAALAWAPQVEEQINGWSWPGDAWLKEVPLDSLAAQLKEAVQFKKSSAGYTSTLAQMLTARWAETDPSAALTWARSLPAGGMRSEAAAGVFKSWSQNDPAAVLEFLASDATTGERWNAFAALGKLAETDPRSAMDWFEKVRGIPDPNCIPHIYRQWCLSDEAQARDYAMAMEDPVLRKDCLDAWAASAKPQGLWDALTISTDTETQSALLKSMALKFAGSSEDATRLRKSIVEGSVPGITPQIAAYATERLAYSSPQEALEWATSLPAALQAASVKKAVSQWAGKDRVAAAQAVEKLPEGPAKTEAAAALPR